MGHNPQPMRPPNVFSAGDLDRVAHLRSDAAWIAQQLEREESRIAVVWRAKSLVTGVETPQAVLLPTTTGRSVVDAAESLILLGVAGEATYFAADVSATDDPMAELCLEEGTEFLDLRQIGGRLPPHEGHLLAYARAITTWHQRHRFCGLCGAPTRVTQAGHLRTCSSQDCATDHFPRTDPAVIMLVHRGDEALLGRQESWPPGVYSTLAGFVEPGESLEDAVAREVHEESGIEVSRVRYHSSQPWPFPTSLMLGFHAEARTGTVDLRDGELEDALWIGRRELLEKKESREIRLPARLSIARRLIDDWLDDGA